MLELGVGAGAGARRGAAACCLSHPMGGAKRALDAEAGDRGKRRPWALPSTSAVAPAHLPVPDWQYEDTSGKLQGPFPLSSMQEWFAGGFLPLSTRVRRASGPSSSSGEFFELSCAPEIAGSKADGVAEGAAELTVEQWKAAGDAHMAGRRVAEAIAAYTSGLRCGSGSGSGSGSADPCATLRAALLSNRSGAHLLQDDAASATADAKQCVEARPDWARAHYRLAAALIAAKQFSDALVAADAAERLDPTPSNAEIKEAALTLLRQEAATEGPEADGSSAARKRRELLQKFHDPKGDSEIRQRRKVDLPPKSAPPLATALVRPAV